MTHDENGDRDTACSIRDYIRAEMEQIRPLVRAEIEAAIKELVAEESRRVLASIRGQHADRLSVKVLPDPQASPPSVPVCDAASPASPSAPQTALSSPSAIPTTPAAMSDRTALYLYCIGYGDGSPEVRGIDEEPVFSIRIQELSAVVHACRPVPYQSDDPDAVKKWVVDHQRVIDAATSVYQTVVPFGFDTIISPTEDTCAADVLAVWIESDYSSLLRKVDVIRGKSEYAIQISVSPGRDDGDQMAEPAPPDDTAQEKPGLSYLYSKKAHIAKRRKDRDHLVDLARECYQVIESYTADIVTHKNKPPEDENKMILNLSCLVGEDMYPELCTALDRLVHQKNVLVRFTGPWPAYSFV